MEFFHALPDDIVFQASRRVLRFLVQDHVNRLMTEFPEVTIGESLGDLAGIADSPKLRHWLSVSRNLLRAKAQTIDPEARFMSHFEVDGLEQSRLCELHWLRALEAVFDDALAAKRPLLVELPSIKCPLRWNVWGHGSVLVTEDLHGIRLETDESGNGRIKLGEYIISISNEKFDSGGLPFRRDPVIETPSGNMVIAANVAGLGDAYHSNAPVIRSLSAIDAWSRTLIDAVRLLAEVDARVAAGCLRLSRAICPLHCGGSAYGSSSPADVIGLVFLPGVLDPYDVAECLLHESLHQKLYHAEEGAAVFVAENGDEEIYYSPWRSDPRPLRMLVHGAYVFTGVSNLWKIIGDLSSDEDLRRTAAFHRHYRCGQARRAMEIVGKYGQLTAFGEKITAIIWDGIAGMESEPSPDNFTVHESVRRQETHFDLHKRYLH